jgi:hypothetical protein
LPIVARAARRWRWRRGPLLATLAAALVLGATAAHAQPVDAKAAAEALFDQGKKLVAAGNLAAACPKFEESLRAAAGLGAMLWLADCYETTGRTASAWAQFREAAAFAAERGDTREKVARKRAATLEPKLSKLVVSVLDRPNGLEVKRDDVVVKEGIWNNEVPVDPGEHTIVASAPNRKPWKAIVRVPPGPAVTPVTVGVLAVEEDPRPAPPLPPPPTATRPDAPPEPAPPASSSSTQRTVGLVVAGVGVIGVGVGVVFGLKAKSQNDDTYSGHCNANGVCDAAGLQGRVDALNSATVSTIGFVAGGIAVAAGAIIYFTAPSVGLSKRSAGLALAPTFTPSGGGVALRGAW